MDNLGYLQRLGWQQWSTPYSRERGTDSVDAYNRMMATIIYDKSNKNMNDKPTVIVVGERGCGKSSLIESIIGTGFLPKGCSIQEGVTKCPVIIDLVRIEYNDTYRYRRWVEFEHINPPKQFLNLDEVENEIRSKMEEVTYGKCGNGDQSDIGEILDNPIHLTYFSTDVCNMTLIDLPGLILVPENQSQGSRLPPPDEDSMITNCSLDMTKASSDSESKEHTTENMNSVNRLIARYMQKQNSIILAVLQGDLLEKTNHVMQFVKKSIDQSQNRILTVITKWDLISNTTLSEKILLGEMVFNPQGVVGVINRSEEDVQERNRSVQDVQVASVHFFRRYMRGFDKIDTNVGAGPKYLIQRICELVMNSK